MSPARVPDELLLAFRGTAIVTGANVGVGEQIALALAGSAQRVVLACRSLDKAEAARHRILTVHPRACVEVEALDLSALDSVRAFVKRWRERGDSRVDLLCCNAGAILVEKACTEDGFELNYQANALGHFLLSILMLPFLVNAPSPRITYTSSGVAFSGVLDPQSAETPGPWSGLTGIRDAYQAYSNSKLYQCLSAEELRRRLARSPRHRHISISLAHPGFVYSQFTQRALPVPQCVVALVNTVTWMFGRSPEQGSRSVLWAALSPSIDPARPFYADSRPSTLPPFCEDDRIRVDAFEMMLRECRAELAL